MGEEHQGKGDRLAFKLTSAENMFPTPLFRFEVDDAASLNRALLGEIEARRAAEAGISKSNRNGWHSKSDLFARKEPAQAKLSQMLLVMLASVTREVAPETDFTDLELVPDGWININPKGGYNSPHDHPGAFWSGCYYVKVPVGKGDAGAIEFLSPHKPLMSNNLVRGAITVDKMRVRPTEGLVLIFPGTTVHWVHPNDCDEERVTVAFNARFRSNRRA